MSISKEYSWRRLQVLTNKGGGLWQPDAESLRKLRREIDRRSARMKQVLRDDRIRKEFLGGGPDDEKKVVKTFIGLTSNASNALKRNPKVRISLIFRTQSPTPSRIKDTLVGNRTRTTELQSS